MKSFLANTVTEDTFCICMAKSAPVILKRKDYTSDDRLQVKSIEVAFLKMVFSLNFVEAYLHSCVLHKEQRTCKCKLNHSAASQLRQDWNTCLTIQGCYAGSMYLCMFLHEDRDVTNKNSALKEGKKIQREVELHRPEDSYLVNNSIYSNRKGQS